jgi:hypothetical protein
VGQTDAGLLTTIGNGSVQVTAASVLGAARDVVPVLTKAASYLRNHNRMLPEDKLRVLLPAWLIDMAASDLIFSSGYDAAYYDGVREMFTRVLGEAANLNVAWYLDSGTGQGQLINGGVAQAAGALVSFPTTCVAYLYPEGSWLFTDGGTLDLGVVRDSVLNAGNNYRIFAETFENAVFVGLESLAITMNVTASGTYAPAGPVVAGF